MDVERGGKVANRESRGKEVITVKRFEADGTPKQGETKKGGGSDQLC